MTLHKIEERRRNSLSSPKEIALNTLLARVANSALLFSKNRWLLNWKAFAEISKQIHFNEFSYDTWVKINKRPEPRHVLHLEIQNYTVNVQQRQNSVKTLWTLSGCRRAACPNGSSWAEHWLSPGWHRHCWWPGTKTQRTQELTLEFQIHGAARPIQASIKLSNLDVGGFRDLQSYSELYDE